MRLAIPILINCILVLVVYLTDKYTVAKKLPYITKQIIIGILFGGVSAFASSYGVEWLGAVVNVRDAAPLSAGLILVPLQVLSQVLSEVYTVGSQYTGERVLIHSSLVASQRFLPDLWRQDSES